MNPSATKNWAKSFKAVPKWTKIGIIGVLLMYIGTAGMLSTSLPWWIGKGDSALHLDYIYRLSSGEIPKYHEFVEYPVFHQIEKGYKTQINRAGNNPPLFYIIHTPFVGPLLNSHNWKTAIGVGRAINMVFGVMAILALAWAGWLYGGKRKALMAVAVPAAGGLMYQFTSLNQNYALDALLVTLGVLTMIVWHKLLDHGFKKPYVWALFLLSIAGMSTKATYAVFVGISVFVIFVVAYLHGKGTNKRRFITGATMSALLGLCILISIGWFYYYWNYKTSGKWYTAELPGDFKSRPYKSLPRVLISSGFWANFYGRITAHVNLSILITVLSAAGLIWAAAKTKLQALKNDKVLAIHILLLLLVFAGTTLTQITHAWGIGNFSFRYFLPAILVFSLFIAYGLLEFKRDRGIIFSLILVAMAINSVYTTARLDNTAAKVPAVTTTQNIIEKLNIANQSNGFPEFVLVLLLLLLAAGVATTIAAIIILTKPAVRKSKAAS